MHRGSRRRSDDGDALGIFRQRLFVTCIKKPFLRKLCLELLKGNVEVTHTLGRQLRTIKLIRTVAREYGNAAEGNDLHAVFRLEAK